MSYVTRGSSAQKEGSEQIPTVVLFKRLQVDDCSTYLVGAARSTSRRGSCGTVGPRNSPPGLCDVVYLDDVLFCITLHTSIIKAKVSDEVILQTMFVTFSFRFTAITHGIIIFNEKHIEIKLTSKVVRWWCT